MNKPQTDETAVTVVSEAPPALQEESVLSIISRAAANPQVDVAKMEALIAMQERIQAHQAKAAFMGALARLQPRLPRITRDGKIEVNGIVRSTYAKYEDIDKEIRPLLADEGFAVSFNSRETAGKMEIEMTLLHRDGYSETNTITLPYDNSGSKNATQGVGSTRSYGQRYLICMKLNIVTVGVDDDGKGSEPITKDQLNRIMDLIVATGADQKKFLAYAGAETFEQITQAAFPKAIKALQAKAAKVKQ